MATPGLLKTKVFWNKGYDIIISIHDATNKILSRFGTKVWPKFGICGISMRKVVITSILYGFDQKNCFFWGLALVQVNNLGLVRGTNLKVYTSVAKLKLKVKNEKSERLKLEVRKFWGLIPTLAEVTWKSHFFVYYNRIYLVILVWLNSLSLK